MSMYYTINGVNISHSAKGSTWKNHLYTAKINAGGKVRYIYGDTAKDLYDKSILDYENAKTAEQFSRNSRDEAEKWYNTQVEKVGLKDAHKVSSVQKEIANKDWKTAQKITENAAKEMEIRRVEYEKTPKAKIEKAKNLVFKAISSISNKKKK